MPGTVSCPPAPCPPVFCPPVFCPPESAYRSTAMSPALATSASMARCAGFHGNRPLPTKRGAAESPTKNGATASCSSSASPAARNCVCTDPPPSTSSRRTPRTARSARTRSSSTGFPASTTSAAAPVGYPGIPPGARPHQQDRVVGANRGGADQDRVAARPERVHAVDIGGAGQPQRLARCVVDVSVQRHRAAQQDVWPVHADKPTAPVPTRRCDASYGIRPG